MVVFDQDPVAGLHSHDVARLLELAQVGVMRSRPPVEARVPHAVDLDPKVRHRVAGGGSRRVLRHLLAGLRRHLRGRAGGIRGARLGWVGVALAFGLTVMTMAYAVGHISGGHFNPAVTVGLWAGGRFPAAKVPVYVVAQVLGAIAAARTARPGRRAGRSHRVRAAAVARRPLRAAAYALTVSPLARRPSSLRRCSRRCCARQGDRLPRRGAARPEPSASRGPGAAPPSGT